MVNSFGAWETRRHGLPDLDGPVDDDAVEWGADVGALEIDAGAVQRRLVQRDIGLGIFELCLGTIEVCAGALLCRDCRIEGDLSAGTLGDKFLSAMKIELGLVQIGLGPLDRGLLQRHIGFGDGDRSFALADLALEGRGLDPGQHLILLDLRTVIDIDLADIAGKLGPDVDGHERTHGA